MTYAYDALPAEALRWRLDPATLGFETTADLEPVEGVIGQDPAVDALRFGLEFNAPGQNIFVRGLTGTGRSTIIRRLLEEIAPSCPLADDRCYVHNFKKPDRPKLLTLPRGSAPAFRDRMDEFAEFIESDLGPALSDDAIKARTKAIEKATVEKIQALTKPFDAELAQADLTMVVAQVGSVNRQLILPLIDGEPAPPERLEALKREEKLTEEQIDELRKRAEQFHERLEEVGSKIQTYQSESAERLRELIEAEAGAICRKWFASVRIAWPDEGVGAFLDDVVEDVVERGLQRLGQGDAAFTARYRVNLIESHSAGEGAPIIEEGAPSVQALLGTIDRSVSQEEAAQAPHMLIYPGAILRADGGFLILEARDVLAEPGAWRALVRTLRTGRIEMVSQDGPVTWRVPPIKPEPIPVQVKVVLLGGGGLYYRLDALDADFPYLFKVLADFEDVIDRDDTGIEGYGRVVARFARDEDLMPFDRSGVAALVEHGARVAARQGKLTARFGRIADIAREAEFIAKRRPSPSVSSEDVSEAVARTKQRANLPSRRFRDAVASGVMRIETQGAVIGQINGLAVVNAGPLTYGFPSRITASVGPGTEGAINIEGEAQMSGRIHTKGFHILLGMLRNLLQPGHPLAFDASIAFEQSYGGIDGDSASGAELCCILSAFGQVPARQDLAMTGAIDQLGNIEPIGAVNEKIEGFFDVCANSGLSGTQGVIIPRSNAGDLMLRPDVVEACERGDFAVYAVGRIEEALGLFMDVPPADLLERCRARASSFWEQVKPHG